MQTAKTLIRLGGCLGWSESSLGTHATLLVLSWVSSNVSVTTTSWVQDLWFIFSSEKTGGEIDYKTLSWVWGADEKFVRGSLFGITGLCRVMPNSEPERRIFLSAPNNHDRFFFLHTFWSPAFDFNIGVAINESHSYTLTSAILKVGVVCDIAMTLIPNVLTTELCDLLYSQCINNTCCYSVLCPQLQRSWRGILVLGCPCMRASVCPFVMFFDACHILWTVGARNLKFHIWIPHGKIADPYFFSCPNYLPFWSYGPLKKSEWNLVSKISRKVFKLGAWNLVSW